MDDVKVDNDRPDIPLTYESLSQLHLVDLHTSIFHMKQKEFEYMKKLDEKEAEIESLTRKLFPQEVPQDGVVIVLPTRHGDATEVVVPSITAIEMPVSCPVKRTRSHRQDVTPFSVNANVDLGKNYRNYQVYRQYEAQRIIDELVASTNKNR